MSRTLILIGLAIVGELLGVDVDFAIRFQRRQVSLPLGVGDAEKYEERQRR